MSDTDRLYALSSVFNHPWLSDTAGPGLLITDAVVAMRWYLTNEREENLDVTGHVSDDDGATWQELAPHELLADAESALATRAQQPGEEASIAALLRDALAADAADWLDDRIRYVQPDDPIPYRPPTPTLASWRLGGQIWGLALGTVPNEQVTAHLSAQYADPQPEGPDQLRLGAQDTLTALALADDPVGTPTLDLIDALAHLQRLTFGSEIGQLKDRAQHAQERILDQLVTRQPQTAPVAAAHPDPQHPAHQAARAYLRRLSLIGLGGEQHRLDDAARDFTDALAAAEAAPEPAAVDAEAPAREAIPGYPKELEGDLQAAAQWRLISPAARRDAERTMDWLVRAETSLLTEVSTATDVELPAGRGEGQTRHPHSDLHRKLAQELDQLNAQHTLLMYASVLAEAEEAAEAARHDAIRAAAKPTGAAHGQPRTTGEARAEHEAFMAQVNQAEGDIAQALGEQRQLTRDVLHQYFPRSGSRMGMHRLRDQLIEQSGLGFDAYNRAARAPHDARRTLESRENRFNSGISDLGHPPVTAEQVEQARAAVQEADLHFDGLHASRSLTLRATKALDGVARLEPSATDSVAARAARIATRSRQRTLHTPARPTDQRQHHTPEQNGQQTPGPQL